MWLVLGAVLALPLRPTVRLFSDGSRPLWSVCGQPLCYCQPVPSDPDCSLCSGGNFGAERCSGVAVDMRRVPLQDTEPDGPVAAPERGSPCVLVVLPLLLSIRAADATVATVGQSWFVGRETVPNPMTPEVPTPPPRA
jgi:hypothetical protein